MEVDTQAGRKAVTGGANFRVITQRFKALSDRIDESGGTFRGVFSDNRPDLCKIILRSFSDAEFQRPDRNTSP